MCGIAGIISSDNPGKRKDLVTNMLENISYRGPDESGIYHSELATIGNVRLSIIDVASGQQPLCDSSGRYWIVFNGEIFNYIELRAKLEKKGVLFKTSSDTEVIVQAFSVWGKDCLTELNGQFAFAIWDKETKKVFIARDRMGIRPIFYHYNNKSLYFGSEIKTIFSVPELTPIFSAKGLNQVFTFWAAVSPNTAFEGINQLPPGHFLEFDGKNLKIERYWQLPFGEVKERKLDDALEEFHELFSSSVRIRLRADVEVAAYLSGGLDSSATVAYIKDIEPSVLNTFSIGFEEKEFNESSYQNEAVKYFDTNHHFISITNQDIAEKFQNIVWHSETPLIRTAPVPMYLLSKLVYDNDIKVVITGEGADEMFGGYNIFKESMIRHFWARQPESNIRPLLLKKLYPYIPQLSNANPRVLKMFFNYKLDETDNPFYSHLLRWNNTSKITNFFNPEFHYNSDNTDGLYEEIFYDMPSGFNSWENLQKAQWLESRIFMAEYLLAAQGDRMAMANSVEGRYPFLDHRVVEFAAKLPGDFKLKGLNEKFFLKSLMKGRIPETIAKRPKQAYRAPIVKAFIGKNAPEHIKHYLSEETFKNAGVFNYDSIKQSLNKIQSMNNLGELDNMLVSSVLSTHMLHDQFMNGNSGGLSRKKLSNLRIINDKY